MLSDPAFGNSFPGKSVLCHQAAVAAYMAVHCHGKRIVRLHEGYVTTTAENENQDLEEVKELSVVKAVADENASRRIDLFLESREREIVFL